jgi:hypothetical protein
MPTLAAGVPPSDKPPLTIGGVKVSLLWMDWAPFLYDANLWDPAASVDRFGDDGLPIGRRSGAAGVTRRPRGSQADQVDRGRAWPPTCRHPLGSVRRERGVRCRSTGGIAEAIAPVQ